MMRTEWARISDRGRLNSSHPVLQHVRNSRGGTEEPEIPLSDGAQLAPNSFCIDVIQPPRNHAGKTTTPTRITRETRPHGKLYMDKWSLEPESKSHWPRNHLSSFADEWRIRMAVRQPSESLINLHIAETTQHGIDQPPGQLKDPVDSVRIVNFENGIYEAEQEMQYGNPAMFLFLGIFRWIKNE